MRRCFGAAVLAALALLACEPQPWPMGTWEGQSTLVHLETMEVTLSPITVVSFYPGYMPGLGVDDPRFGFTARLPGRRIQASGQPNAGRPSSFFTSFDGGLYVGLAGLVGEGDRLLFDVAWARPDARSGASTPAEYNERASLRRTGNYDQARPPP